MQRLRELSRDFRLVALPAAPLTAALEARVAAIWDAEKERRGRHLHDGPIYTVVDIAADRMVVRPMAYRHLVALRLEPGLAAAGLALRPVGVTGVVRCTDGVVLGRRAAHVAADAGLWEPAPSGGLDRPDPAAQLMDELGEELGVAARLVATPPRICGLVENTDRGAFDILFQVTLRLDASALLALHRDAATDEYSELAVVPPAALRAFLNSHGDALLPAAEAMLRRAGALPEPG